MWLSAQSSPGGSDPSGRSILLSPVGSPPALHSGQARPSAAGYSTRSHSTRIALPVVLLELLDDHGQGIPGFGAAGMCFRTGATSLQHGKKSMRLRLHSLKKKPCPSPRPTRPRPRNVEPRSYGLSARMYGKNWLNSSRFCHRLKNRCRSSCRALCGGILSAKTMPRRFPNFQEDWKKKCSWKTSL